MLPVSLVSTHSSSFLCPSLTPTAVLISSPTPETPYFPPFIFKTIKSKFSSHWKEQNTCPGVTPALYSGYINSKLFSGAHFINIIASLVAAALRLYLDPFLITSLKVLLATPPTWQGPNTGISVSSTNVPLTQRIRELQPNTAFINCQVLSKKMQRILSNIAALKEPAF